MFPHGAGALLSVLCCIATRSAAGVSAPAAFGAARNVALHRRHHAARRRISMPGGQLQERNTCAMVMPQLLLEAGTVVRCASSLYFHALHQYPLATNIMQGALLAGLGDLLSQRVERNLETYSAGQWKPRSSQIAENVRRVINAAIAGIIFSGLAVPAWYNVLHVVVPGNSARAAVAKTALDCTFFSLTGNGAALVLRECLAGAGLSAAWRAMARNIVSVMVMDLKVWPIYDMMCFTLIPESIQPLSTAVVSLLWNAYMSWVVCANSLTLRKRPKGALPVMLAPAK
ncbi:unnamed protein product [Phaeothamnion confervicola]